MSRIIYTPYEYKKPRKPFLGKESWQMGIVVFGLLVLLGGGVYLLRLPQWQISEFEISGLNVLTTEEIGNVIRGVLGGSRLFLFPRSSFFLASSGAVVSGLQKAYPRIKQVSVKKEFPDKLNIFIAERALWGIFCSSLSEKKESPQQCVYVDETGFAYEYAPSSQGSLIMKIKDDRTVSVPAQLVDPALMAQMIFSAQEIEKATRVEVTGYELSSKIPREFWLETNEGFKLFLNRSDDVSKTLNILKTVLEEDIKEKRSRLEYIDLRFGNKVFYKFRK